MQNPFLVGKQIYLRPLEREDAPRFVPWMNAVEVRSNLLSYRPLNLQQETQFLERIGTSENEVVLGIMTRGDDQLIGAAGLDGIDWKNRQTRFGILIGETSQWGKGYGTEATRLLTDYAFAVLNLNRVWLHVYADNRRGQGAYARVGFVREGVLRQAHYHDGRYQDVISMALLRADWEAQRAV